MTLYDVTVKPLSRQLTALDAWLDAAAAFAESKKFDVAVLLNARLAPDQYPLVRQVQSAADAAKFAGARLTGVEAPKNPDTETTLEELHARVRGTVAFLASLNAAAFEGAETRLVPLTFMPGKALTGLDYFNDLAMPNFYFHATTAYSILRHNGVPIGKTQFIGSMSIRDL